jgi:hypothetical protein
MNKIIKTLSVATGVVLMSANLYTMNENINGLSQSQLCFEDIEALGQEGSDCLQVTVNVNLYGSHGANPNAQYTVDYEFLTKDDIVKNKLHLPNGRLYEIGFVPEGASYADNHKEYKVWEKCIGTIGINAASIGGEYLKHLAKCGQGSGTCYIDENCF